MKLIHNRTGMIIHVPNYVAGQDQVTITMIKRLGFDVAYDYIQEKFIAKRQIITINGTIDCTRESLESMVKACELEGIFLEIIPSNINYIDDEYEKYKNMFDELRKMGVKSIDMTESDCEKLSNILRVAVPLYKDNTVKQSPDVCTFAGISINVI